MREEAERARGVAIVGLDCRFPGAADPAAYWDLLLGGADAVGTRPPSRGPAGPDGGFLADADVFDPDFFGISGADAAAMDPQQRLLLQCAWRALEDSGRSPRARAGSATGVYVGSMSDDFTRLSLASPHEITPRTAVGAGRSMLANRLSYQLDLRGPSLTVDTACSSSLVAVHLAATALLGGECDLAVAGGVNLVLDPALDQVYAQASLAAPDGRCKPFAATADGIGRGEGAGVVVLRRLEDALRDGDRVYAVLLGSAVGQDGRSNGITAPHRAAQRDVVGAAHRRAGVRPGQVRFVEAHGTGTPLGDLIEVLALGDVFGGGERPEPLELGSVKGVVGHTEGAAGIAALIKAALALHHGVLPGQALPGGENERLGLARRGMRVVTEPVELPGRDVVCGVSSFGMGGTNVHAVLASAPAVPVPDTDDGAAGVFTLSADTPQALRRNLRVQADRPAGGALVSRCWTSNRSRSALPVRFAAVASDPDELTAALREAAERDGPPGPVREPRVAFAFTGQGSQYPAMTAGLYRDLEVYRRHLDDASDALQPYTVEAVRDILLRGDTAVHRTGTTQPALFAVEYALARTLTELGVTPVAVLGHSIGEFAAAVISGALTLPDAAKLVAVRGAFMQRLPTGGGMLAVRCPAAEADSLVRHRPGVGVAAVNGPEACVLSGGQDDLFEIRSELVARGVAATPLEVSHAFHSPLMEPMLGRFERVARRVPAGTPELLFHSTVLGRELRPGEALDGAYWTRHIAATVRFADAAASLCADPPTHVVEIGPKPVLANLLRRIPAANGIPALGAVRGPSSALPEVAGLLARLYEDGLDPSWDALYRPADRRVAPPVPHQFAGAWRSWLSVPQEPAPRLPDPVPCDDPDDDPADGTDPRAGVVGVVAAVLGGEPQDLRDELRFYDDLGFDSVMLMELKYRLEARFPVPGGLEMPEMLASLVSVGTLVDYIGGLLTAVRA
ncbi:Phenolphthiocerol synthesis polyketide synthase type I Pks15/1 [Streptomyces sp. RB5]|uniref:Phenolphthiocerol synthesis polyketide synthase type I Pks15/1 n=1 Tax=Streptomyces smaragdinus TaxID=2585196 RepID=A0A7K0CG08_9ACTN|nr:type I polyketide synthase [Streptomyces smaragdinus]MQY11664.1 Phenolphthiocerol synthesis polyketide synthase type I Pks15/1 [Streptomyces smaragdinus]